MIYDKYWMSLSLQTAGTEFIIVVGGVYKSPDTINNVVNTGLLNCICGMSS